MNDEKVTDEKFMDDESYKLLVLLIKQRINLMIHDVLGCQITNTNI